MSGGAAPRRQRARAYPHRSICTPQLGTNISSPTPHSTMRSVALVISTTALAAMVAVSN